MANNDQHLLLVANCIAQGKALMLGRENESEPHRNVTGNRPSNTIMLERMDPYTLGMLLALYEHKTFVEAVLWDINPFDQWGVELGKKLATEIEVILDSIDESPEEDSSTRLLLEYYRKHRQPG